MPVSTTERAARPSCSPEPGDRVREGWGGRGGRRRRWRDGGGGGGRAGKKGGGRDSPKWHRGRRTRRRSSPGSRGSSLSIGHRVDTPSRETRLRSVGRPGGALGSRVAARGYWSRSGGWRRRSERGWPRNNGGGDCLRWENGGTMDLRTAERLRDPRRTQSIDSDVGRDTLSLATSIDRHQVGKGQQDRFVSFIPVSSPLRADDSSMPRLIFRCSPTYVPRRALSHAFALPIFTPI